jgi:DNA-directed RNA polymerase subunit M/transcription elongation factor TFIIS
MEDKQYSMVSFAFKNENGWIPPHIEEPFEEEDENTRGFIPTVEEHCPRCKSSCLEPYTTKDGLNILHCKGCDSLLCPRCTSLLSDSHADDGRKVLRCPKCGILS